MRLLNVYSLQLTWFDAPKGPRYVVASHKWLDHEASYQLFKNEGFSNIAGFNKIRNFCSFIRAWHKLVPQLPQWLWIDSLCIDRTSSAELTAAINSMFKWYRNAFICIAYLHDVSEGPITEDSVSSDFKSSVWHTRGWTLQELIAPRYVLFVNRSWEVLGYKGRLYSAAGYDDFVRSAGPTLNGDLEAITGIPAGGLHYLAPYPVRWFSVSLSWLNGRQTTEPEDLAYCMLGLFDCFMPLIYGEGYENARRRLLEEVDKKYYWASARNMIRGPLSSGTTISLGRSLSKAIARDTEGYMDPESATEDRSEKIARWAAQFKDIIRCEDPPRASAKVPFPSKLDLPVPLELPARRRRSKPTPANVKISREQHKSPFEDDDAKVLHDRNKRPPKDSDAA